MDEPISPELVLVDPDLGARARAALPDRVSPPVRRLPSTHPHAAAPVDRSNHYPLWARLTGALWILVLGILIGGAAVPHAQDRPRVLTPAESAAEQICKPAQPDMSPMPGPSRPGP